MKKLIYLFISIILIVIISIIYKKPKVTNFDKKTSLKVDTTVIDVGDIKVNSSIRGRYTLHNIGKENLVVESVLTNCYCTKAEYSSKPIPPESFTVVTLKYDSTRLGIFQSTGIVASNSRPDHTLLVLRGNVIKDNK